MTHTTARGKDGQVGQVLFLREAVDNRAVIETTTNISDTLYETTTVAASPAHVAIGSTTTGSGVSCLLKAENLDRLIKDRTRLSHVPTKHWEAVVYTGRRMQRGLYKGSLGHWGTGAYTEGPI